MEIGLGKRTECVGVCMHICVIIFSLNCMVALLAATILHTQTQYVAVCSFTLVCNPPINGKKKKKNDVCLQFPLCTKAVKLVAYGVFFRTG